MNATIGRSTVRTAGMNLTDGTAFVRVGNAEEVRVRWRLTPVRWRCDAHRDQQDCTHTRAVIWHITGTAMKENRQ